MTRLPGIDMIKIIASNTVVINEACSKPGQPHWLLKLINWIKIKLR
jgi:hypothetical protein